MHIRTVLHHAPQLLGRRIQVEGCLFLQSRTGNWYWYLAPSLDTDTSLSIVLDNPRLRAPQPSFLKRTPEEREAFFQQQAEERRAHREAFLQRFDAGEFRPLTREDAERCIENLYADDDTSDHALALLRMAGAEKACEEYVHKPIPPLPEHTVDSFSFLSGLYLRIPNEERSSPILDRWSNARVTGCLIRDEDGVLTLSEISCIEAQLKTLYIRSPRLVPLTLKPNVLPVYDVVEHPDLWVGKEVMVHGCLFGHIIREGIRWTTQCHLAPNRLFRHSSRPESHLISLGGLQPYDFFERLTQPHGPPIGGSPKYDFEEPALLKGILARPRPRTTQIPLEFRDISQAVLFSWWGVVAWTKAVQKTR